MNGSHTMNIAQGSATVGVQTEAIHGDVTVYLPPPDPSPADIFELGVRVLHGGMAPRAREYIRDAVLKGHVTSRSCFYLLLAMLSGRTPQQVPLEEIAMLRSVRARLDDEPGDAWADGIKLITRLMATRSAGEQDALNASAIEDQLKALDDEQRGPLLQHLELFLHSSVKNGFWAGAFTSAKADRYDKDRLRRVWKFFQPTPAGARVLPARPVSIAFGEWLRATTASVLALVCISSIGAAAWQHAWPSTVAAFLLLAIGGYAGARHGIVWRFHNERIQAKDQEYRATRGSAAKPHGFAGKIDRQFEHYFARYTPDGADRDQWLAETAGVRRALRDEIVTIYREQRVDAKQVAWLVRYLVSDVAKRWREGTLWAYREQLRVPAATKAWCLLGATAVVTGAAIAVWNGLQDSPFTVVIATLLAGAASRPAALSWLRISIEHKRHAADRADAERRLADRQAAYDRWKRKLADQPSDLEMAHWLDCDRRALLEEAMLHYKLTPDDVLAHACIEAPARTYKRAQVKGGPWRYSRYTLLLFLLTKDGVRQFTADLDFEQATFQKRQRINYRYDAVAAVKVTEADEGQIVFELTLVNGDPITVKVTGPHPALDVTEEDRRSVFQATLDTVGLENTLHVLEGIAAEGKEWINHEQRREKAPLAQLTKAVDALFA